MDFVEEITSPGRRRFRGRTESLVDNTEIQTDIEEINEADHCENKTGIFFTCRTLVSLRLSDDENYCKKSCGFHLTRSKWDPYPWVGYIESGSVADLAGLRAGDCLLEINGIDVVGLRVKDIATLIKKYPGATINLQLWRNSDDNQLQSAEEGAALSGPLPTLVRKLAKALSGAVSALECPVCLETATSPVSQCVHGHILCVGCRTKTPRCPVCRVRLGQGRCLLADEVQRNIREAFEDTKYPTDATNSTNCSLREKLFGKVGRKNENTSRNASGIPVSPIKTRMSLARLLLGGFEKAVSADNLSATNLQESRNFHRTESTATCRRLGELTQSDRAKSASTGELSRNNDSQMNEPLQCLGDRKAFKSSAGYLSIPQTPTWGGSTESMGNNSFLCPLASRTQCREPCNYDNYIEHMGRTHLCTQIHIWLPNATIPIPLSFGVDSLPVIHHQGELFFFHYEDEAAWLMGTGGKNDWILHGWSSDGTEVKLRRAVVKIDDLKPLPGHLAPIPKALGITVVNVELIQTQAEALEI